jgi:hypothetical protein
VIVAEAQDKLKLGKGAAFVKSRLRRLRQEADVWEADFRALPKPMMQNATHYLGLVVTQPDGFLLADAETAGRPSVNDLATLLAHAMRRPAVEGAHRPRRLHLRKNPRWQELFPHLTDIGIEVVVHNDLPLIDEAFADFLHQMKETRAVGNPQPSPEQAAVEQAFPAIAQWINGGYGHLEIGDQEGFGFVVRALDYGGLVFEDDKARTLTEAMAILEAGLTGWFKDA